MQHIAVDFCHLLVLTTLDVIIWFPDVINVPSVVLFHFPERYINEFLELQISDKQALE